MIPTNFNTVKLITDIASIGANYGIAVKNIQIKEENSDNAQEISLGGQKKSFQTTLITFKFSSNYQNLELFLKDLESSLQLIDVRSIAFNIKEDNSPIYDYTVSLQAYWVK